jgi:hypothetical protein
VAQKFLAPVKQPDGSVWQYMIETHFAFGPMYIQGTLVWLQRYWVTYPVDQNGKKITLYVSLYPWDPRTKTEN